jgi:hypothetical protein
MVMGQGAPQRTTSDQAARASERLCGGLAYAVILLTCFAGMLHASWWSACAGASLLALLSIADPHGSHAYFARSIGRIGPAALFASTTLNAAAAAATAYLLGRAIAWFWSL